MKLSFCEHRQTGIPILKAGFDASVWGGLPQGLSDELERIQICCLIIGISTSSLPSLSENRDEATIHTFTNILKDNSLPLPAF